MLRDTFSNANDQRNFGFNRFDDSVGSEWWGNVDDGSFRFRLVVSLHSSKLHTSAEVWQIDSKRARAYLSN